jgi:hypothetical protein
MVFPEKLENTKGVMRSRRTNDGKYNDKNDKTSNNNLELFPVFVVHTFLNPVPEVLCVIWSLMFNIYTLSY